jgi:hypothetical protein
LQLFKCVLGNNAEDDCRSKTKGCSFNTIMVCFYMFYLFCVSFLFHIFIIFFFFFLFSHLVMLV